MEKKDSICFTTQMYVKYSTVAIAYAVFFIGRRRRPFGIRSDPPLPRIASPRHASCSLRGMDTRDFKEKYWRYSLYALILGLGTAAFIELRPFLGGLLGAVTIYMLLRGQMRYLSERRRWRRSLAASVLLAEAIFCFLIPISLVVWMLVDRIQHVAADPHLLLDPLRHLAASLHEKTGYDLLQEANIDRLVACIPRAGHLVVSGLFNFGVNIVVLSFVLYFMLIGGSRMETYCRELMPFSRPVARRVMDEIRIIVRSNAIGIPLLAVAQGLAAYLGYLVFRVPDALFWGVVTSFTTVIPIVGTALAWVPLALFLAADGRWGAAAGLLLYGMLAITQVDNVVRFVLQKKMADTHPLVTIFGVVIGLSLFGFMGVIFGPLLLSMLIFCVDLFKRRYVEGVPIDRLYLSKARNGR